MKGYKTGDIKQGNTLLKLDKNKIIIKNWDSIPIFCFDTIIIFQ
jgi:hypothetical protein